MEYGFFDGEFVALDEPKVQLEDRGYQFGDGIYEATRIYNGKLLHWSAILSAAVTQAA